VQEAGLKDQRYIEERREKKPAMVGGPYNGGETEEGWK